jgi:hypothetical protein
VPFHLAFTLRDLVERLNAVRCDIFDPGARSERRFGLGLMQNSLDGRERWRAPRQADDGGASR